MYVFLTVSCCRSISRQSVLSAADVGSASRSSARVASEQGSAAGAPARPAPGGERSSAGAKRVGTLTGDPPAADGLLENAEAAPRRRNRVRREGCGPNRVRRESIGSRIRSAGAESRENPDGPWIRLAPTGFALWGLPQDQSQGPSLREHLSVKTTTVRRILPSRDAPASYSHLTGNVIDS
jgi:hypothetical protein